MEKHPATVTLVLEKTYPDDDPVIAAYEDPAEAEREARRFNANSTKDEVGWTYTKTIPVKPARRKPRHPKQQ